MLKKKKVKKKNSENQKEIQSADKNSMMHFKFVMSGILVVVIVQDEMFQNFLSFFIFSSDDKSTSNY